MVAGLPYRGGRKVGVARRTEAKEARRCQGGNGASGAG